MNNTLKFHKIPFRNGISKQSLDKSSFPAEDLLTKMIFFQAYKNWLMSLISSQLPMWSLVGMSITPECLQMTNLPPSLMCGGIWTSNYILSLSPAHSKLNHIAPLTYNCWKGLAWTPFSLMQNRLNRHLISSGCPTMDPIQLETKITILVHTCFPCMTRTPKKGGHQTPFMTPRSPFCASAVDTWATVLELLIIPVEPHPKWPISCDWKQDRLISKSTKFLHHVQCSGLCMDTFMNHGAHFCSLCGNTGHPACCCPIN